MTTLTLPYGYFIEIDSNRNYQLWGRKKSFDKKTKEEKEITKMLGYYSSLENAIKIGYIKELEATKVKPNIASLTGFIRALDDIETKAVEDFKKVIEVNLTEREKEAVL